MPELTRDAIPWLRAFLAQPQKLRAVQDESWKAGYAWPEIVHAARLLGVRMFRAPHPETRNAATYEPVWMLDVESAGVA